MRQFRYDDEADRTMSGQAISESSVWIPFRTRLQQVIKECYTMQQLRELLKKARAEIETFSIQDPPSRNWYASVMSMSD